LLKGKRIDIGIIFSMPSWQFFFDEIKKGIGSHPTPFNVFRKTLSLCRKPKQTYEKKFRNTITKQFRKETPLLVF